MPDHVFVITLADVIGCALCTCGLGILGVVLIARSVDRLARWVFQ